MLYNEIIIRLIKKHLTKPGRIYLPSEAYYKNLLRMWEVKHVKVTRHTHKMTKITSLLFLWHLFRLPGKHTYYDLLKHPKIA